MNARHFGFTGTQCEPTSQQKEGLRKVFSRLLEEGYTWQHNGDCIGSDYSAAGLWLELGGAIHLHPPSIDKKRAFLNDPDDASPPKPYRERNQDIVSASETLVATPKGGEEELRSGTWMTIRMARRKGIPIFIIWPDGKVTGGGE